ncbi:MAG: GWxTD domain-containing protein [Candidatus Eisenbacteria bacterium]
MSTAIFHAILLILLLAPALPAADGEEYVEPHPGEDRFFTVILSEDRRLEYESYPPEDRAEWRRRFWAAADPTPTTDENQREMEHQRRVVEAIRTFRNEDDRFVYDDRAKSYIRFGIPDRREILPGEVAIHTGMVPPREFWLYPDMILWFEDWRLRGEYVEGLDEKVSLIGGLDQNLREDTGWSVDDELLFEESFEQFLKVNDVEVDPTLARRFQEDGKHRWVKVPEINDYDYEGSETFRFFFDVTSFAGAGGKTDLLVGFLVPLEKTEWAVEEGRETAKIQRRSALLDENLNLVERHVENLVHASDPVGGRSSWIVTSDSFSVAPGFYNLALRVIDVRSQNHGIMETPVEAPDFGGDSVRVSDLLFAVSFDRETRAEGAYLRGGYRIVPRPIRIYAPGEDVNVYFEVYHITTGEGGKGLYEVEYTLFGTKAERFVSFFGGSSEGRLEQGISQTFRSQSDGSMAARRISLDTESLPEDRYTLIIRVKDLADGATDQAKAFFVVKS